MRSTWPWQAGGGGAASSGRGKYGAQPTTWRASHQPRACACVPSRRSSWSQPNSSSSGWGSRLRSGPRTPLMQQQAVGSTRNEGRGQSVRHIALHSNCTMAGCGHPACLPAIHPPLLDRVPSLPLRSSPAPSHHNLTSRRAPPVFVPPVSRGLVPLPAHPSLPQHDLQLHQKAAATHPSCGKSRPRPWQKAIL